MKRRMRMGMVGGGPGSFIGPVHRIAAMMDNRIELVCGCFDVVPERSLQGGRDLFLPSNRVYSTYPELFEKEKKLPEGERMDFVSIVTPNAVHFPVAKMALESGFNVVCEKPMTFNLEQAQELEKLVKKTGLLFALTHNYTGYPMVKEARNLVQSGKLGKIRKIVVEYPQGWLATRLEATGQQQAAWRTDPKQAGGSCCVGDIGTHAENLTEYITGLRIEDLCADLTTFVPGRPLEDDGNVLMRLTGGARGVLYASQISVGEENALHIRVYGEKGGLQWHQQEPNTLIVKWPDRPSECYRSGGDHGYLSKAALANTRLPSGHPEGFYEAFANIYRNFATSLAALKEGKTPSPEENDFPKVGDGVRGMAFIQTVLESAKGGSKWVRMPQ